VTTLIEPNEAARRLATEGMFEFIRAQREVKQWTLPGSACSDAKLFDEVGGDGVEHSDISDSADEEKVAAAQRKTVLKMMSLHQGELRVWQWEDKWALFQGEENDIVGDNAQFSFPRDAAPEDLFPPPSVCLPRW